MVRGGDGEGKAGHALRVLTSQVKGVELRWCRDVVEVRLRRPCLPEAGHAGPCGRREGARRCERCGETRRDETRQQEDAERRVSERWRGGEAERGRRQRAARWPVRTRTLRQRQYNSRALVVRRLTRLYSPAAAAEESRARRRRGKIMRERPLPSLQHLRLASLPSSASSHRQHTRRHTRASSPIHIAQAIPPSISHTLAP